MPTQTTDSDHDERDDDDPAADHADHAGAEDRHADQRDRANRREHDGEGRLLAELRAGRSRCPMNTA